MRSHANAFGCRAPDHAAVQARNPKKDLPIAIIGSLTLATTLVRPPLPVLSTALCQSLQA